MTTRAILSIVLFIAVYLILVILAFGLTSLCAYAGIALVIAHPSLVTLMLGIGLASMGVLIVIFLFKFLSKKHVVDRSYLIEIRREDYPELFAFIQEVVEETHTKFPKKVYLSAEVNAAVFYDSSFWSMFFPTRKNLQIGLALVNTNTKNEFKAILAHEFGHFSQRSMKVGSYVYNVNQIIYNLLYDNASYDNLAQSWANISGYLSFFVILTVKIVHGIQWCLKQVYQVVNLNYMALSREMEFHADAVAANVTGSAPLITSLLRMDLADSAFNTVLAFYNDRVQEAKKTNDIYTQQQFVLHFLANEQGLPLKNNLPLVGTEHLSRYNRSKLNITDQWSSHPSVKDRIRELQNLNIIKNSDEDAPATVLFRNIDQLQSDLTKKLFSNVRYGKIPVDVGTAEFIDHFTDEYKKNSFSKFFNSYYDSKNPPKLIIDGHSPPMLLADPFSDEMVDLLCTSISLEKDLSIIRQIENETYKVKSFDYDGIKYRGKDCRELIQLLEKELFVRKEAIQEHDKKIHLHFLKLSLNQGQESLLKEHYLNFFTATEEFERKYAFYSHLIIVTNFFHETTRYEAIEDNLLSLKNFENDLKKYIQELLKHEHYHSEIPEEMKTNFTKYTTSNLTYFKNENYDTVAVNILFTAIHNFNLITSKIYFMEKQRLLSYLERLQNQAIS